MDSDEHKRPGSVQIILVVVAISIFTVLLYFVGLEELSQKLHQADVSLLALAGFFALAGTSIRGLKWWLLFYRVGLPIGPKRFWPQYFIANAIGALTPMRSGEVVSAGIVPKEGFKRAGHAAFVVVLDRVIELILLLAHAAISFILLGILVEELPFGKAFWVSFGVLISVVVLLLSFLIPENAFRFLIEMAPSSRGILRKIIHPVLNVFQDFHAARSALQKPVQTILITIAGSFMAVACMQISVWCAINSVARVSLLNTFTADGMSRLAGVASMLPSGIGTGTIGSAATLNLLGVDLKLALIAVALSVTIIVSISIGMGVLSALINMLKRL